MQFSTPEEGKLFGQAVQDGITELWEASKTDMPRDEWVTWMINQIFKPKERVGS